MLEPRMVAARIQGPEGLLQGAAAFPLLMKATSQGCTPIIAIMFFTLYRDSYIIQNTADAVFNKIDRGTILNSAA
jgi:hypothetical protein